MAGSVTDAALLLNTLAGHDPLDNSSSQRPVEDYTAGLEDREANLTIGVPEEYFGEGLDPEIRSSIESQLSQLEQEGAKLLPVSLPHTKYSIAARSEERRVGKEYRLQRVARELETPER